MRRAINDTGASRAAPSRPPSAAFCPSPASLRRAQQAPSACGAPSQIPAPPPARGTAAMCAGGGKEAGGGEGEGDALLRGEDAVPTGGGEEGEGEATDFRALAAGGFIALVALLLVGVKANGGLSSDTFVRVAEWFQGLGPGGVVVYGALYFAMGLVGLPASPLTVAAGYLFGVPEGTVCVSIASTTTAGAAFLIARYGLRDYISNLANKYPKFRSIDAAIGREGLKFVFLLRLSPLLPFSIGNYLYGLTSVKFPQYLLASWVGMLPATFAYVSAGGALGAITDIDSPGRVSPYILALGAAATVGAIVVVGRFASAAIDESVEPVDGGGDNSLSVGDE